MKKNNMTEEFDLVFFAFNLIDHKWKIIFLGVFGFIFGVLFTYSTEKETEIQFSIEEGINILFINGKLPSGISNLISQSKLKPNDPKIYSFDKKKKIFTFKVKGKAVNEVQDLEIVVRNTFDELLKKDIMIMKDIYMKDNKSKEKLPESRVVISLEGGNNSIDQLKFWENQSNDNKIEGYMNRILYSFGNKNVINPNPFKHGLIGLIVGITFSIIWISLIILNSKLEK